MKKTFFKNIKFPAFLLSLLPLFFSCHGVIFDTIRDEVKLADAVISGDIQDIIRYKDDIYVSTGKISHRSVSLTKDINGKSKEEYKEGEVFVAAADQKSELKSFSSPSGYIYSLAADSNNLYALSVIIEEDDDGYNVPTKRILWCYTATEEGKEGSWKEIWSKSYDGSKDDKAFLFCTNTLNESNRHAYFRYQSKIYELTGEKLGDTGMTLGTTEHSTTPTSDTNSCTVLGSTVYFSSAYAMTSNETSEADSTYIYRSSGDTVYYSTDGKSWESVDLNCDTILSLAITKDYLLAGTASGIVHTPLKADSNDKYAIPSSGNADFDTNADSTLSSYYEVPALLTIDSSKSEKDATIFATCLTSSTSASLNNVGLWSYFATEGEWNRE